MTDTTTDPMHANAPDRDLRAHRERTVRAHVEAESRHDVPATLATFADPNYDVVAFGDPTNGAAAVTAMLQTLFEAFPDFGADIVELHHGDDIVFIEGRLHGTHLGPWAGIPAGGRTMDLRVGAVFHFEGDRLVKETVYFDHATLLAQITS